MGLISVDLPFTCNHFSSKANCTWGSWSSWAPCAVTCGGSLQLRSRIVERQAKNGGTCTGGHVESQKCATTLCPGGKDSIESLRIKIYR